MISLTLERGDVDGALKLLGEALALEPGTLSPRLRAAELLSNGRRKRPTPPHAQALELAPDDPEPHERLGRHRLRAQDDSALAAFTHALSLRPQNRRCASWCDRSGPRSGTRRPTSTTRRRWRNWPPSRPGRQVLADLSVVKGVRQRPVLAYAAVVLRPQSPRGVDAARTQSVQYSPDRQVVKVERARIFKKDGSVLESKSDGERNLSEPWYGLYHDVRARVIGFLQLEPGDVVELVTRIDDSGANFFADYFGDFAYLQSRRRAASDYVLLGPRDGPSTPARALEGLVHTEGKLRDGGTWRRWTAKNVPGWCPSRRCRATARCSRLRARLDVQDLGRGGPVLLGLDQGPAPRHRRDRAARRRRSRTSPRATRRAHPRVYDFVVSGPATWPWSSGSTRSSPIRWRRSSPAARGLQGQGSALMHAMLESLGDRLTRLTLLRMKAGRHRRGARLAGGLQPRHPVRAQAPAVPRRHRRVPRLGGCRGDDRGAEVLVVQTGRGLPVPAHPRRHPGGQLDETRIAAGWPTAAAVRSAPAPGAPGPRSCAGCTSRRTGAAPPGSGYARRVPNVKVTSVDVSDPRDIEKPF